MPPKRRPPADQCAYREGKKRCPNDGLGNPPICPAHAIVLEAAAARQRPRDQVVGFMADAIAGRVSKDQLRTAAHSILGGLVVELESSLPHLAGSLRGGRAAAPPPPAPPPRRTLDPEKRARAVAILKARRSLGFQNGDRIDVETVEKRKRELARKHHPDLGGSVEKMQEVNAAADLLLAELANAT